MSPQGRLPCWSCPIAAACGRDSILDAVRLWPALFARRSFSDLLRETRSRPIGWSQALFMPPFERSLVLSSAPAWERFGLWISPGFSGVIIVEAVKQVYAISSGGKKVRKMVPVLNPALATFEGSAASRPSPEPL